MDTSALLAALVSDHEHHDLARPHLHDAEAIAAIVLAETFAVLRRAFAQPANDVPMVTLDGRQHRLALALGARSTYLLA